MNNNVKKNTINPTKVKLAALKELPESVLFHTPNSYAAVAHRFQSTGPHSHLQNSARKAITNNLHVNVKTPEATNNLANKKTHTPNKNSPQTKKQASPDLTSMASIFFHHPSEPLGSGVACGEEFSELLSSPVEHRRELNRSLMNSIQPLHMNPAKDGLQTNKTYSQG